MSVKKKGKDNYEEFVFSQPMPNFKDVEQIVLGSIMLEGNLADSIMNQLSSDLFYFVSHKKIADAVISLYRENKPLDAIMVCDRLKSTNDLQDIGGDFFVFNLMSLVSSTANIEHHIRLLQEAQLKRSVIGMGSDAVRRCFDPSFDVFDTYNSLMSGLENNVKSLLNSDVKGITEVYDTIISDAKETIKKGTHSGVPSGLYLLDNVTNGFQKSDLIILAGRPSMGKTACAISIAMFPAVNQKMPVAVFSLEMSSEQLVSRMQSISSGINVGRIIKKQLTTLDLENIEYCCRDLRNSPIFIDDTPNINLIELKTKCRRLVKEKGVKMIIIDYLQLMRSGLSISNREQEIAEISRGLKGLAKELSIPIIALSQLSRGVESRAGDKKPMLQDLRESGQIEQDADMVMFCYRPEYYGITEYQIGNTDFDTKGLFLLLVSKHRNGELGEIPLRFIHEQTLVTNRDEYKYKSSIAPIPESLPVTNSVSDEISLDYVEDNEPF